ncbi:MAG: hypothetical protein MPN21_23750 [Thermoanaerobaculia bacterium]|nr:hypothetical protein [Thermoanaerobaculia bacterium]
MWLLWMVPPAVAQDSDEEAPDTGSYWQEHFSLHGHFALAFGDLESETGQRTTDEIILGIEEDGSFPYGNAALTLRYHPAPRHAIVLQVAARDIGDSPVDDETDDIELDWLFYEFTFSDRTRLRLGRHPVAAGIFNQIRDAGILLPFFRPAYTFYRDGALLSETVDGIAISHRFRADRPWSVDADAYYGEFETFQGQRSDASLTVEEATDVFGTQLWLNTPIHGLRVGLGALRWDTSTGVGLPEAEVEDWHVSLDGEFERFVARAEARIVTVDFGAQNPGLTELDIDLAYVQIGWSATDKLKFYLQPEVAEVESVGPLFLGGSTKSRNRLDIGFGTVFHLRHNLALKAEYHEVESEVEVGQELTFGPSGPQVRVLYDTFDSNYYIVGLAASF